MDIKKILKFGGSSISNPERIRTVVSIVLEAAKKERIVIVVSAFQGVTNQLLESARLAELGDAKFQSLYKSLVKRHTSALKILHNNHPPKLVASNLQIMLAELRDVLQGIYLLRHSSPRALDLTASFGERFSALIIASFIQQSQPSCFVDSRDLVTTDDQFTRASVQFDKTNRAIKLYFKKLFETIRQTAYSCCYRIHRFNRRWFDNDHRKKRIRLFCSNFRCGTRRIIN